MRLYAERVVLSIVLVGAPASLVPERSVADDRPPARLLTAPSSGDVMAAEVAHGHDGTSLYAGYGYHPRYSFGYRYYAYRPYPRSFYYGYRIPYRYDYYSYYGQRYYGFGFSQPYYYSYSYPLYAYPPSYPVDGPWVVERPYYVECLRPYDYGGYCCPPPTCCVPGAAAPPTFSAPQTAPESPPQPPEQEPRAPQPQTSPADGPTL